MQDALGSMASHAGREGQTTHAPPWWQKRLAVEASAIRRSTGVRRNAKTDVCRGAGNKLSVERGTDHPLISTDAVLPNFGTECYTVHGSAMQELIPPDTAPFQWLFGHKNQET